MERVNLTCLLFLILVAGLSSHSAETPTGIGDGYKLLFEQKFDAESSLKDFVLTDFKAWKWSKEENGGALALTQQSEYTPAVRSPVFLPLPATEERGEDRGEGRPPSDLRRVGVDPLQAIRPAQEPVGLVIADHLPLGRIPGEGPAKLQ